MVKGGYTPLFYAPLGDKSDTCDNSDPCAEIEFNHSALLVLSDNSDNTRLCLRYIFSWLKTDVIFRFESDLEVSNTIIHSGVFLLPHFTGITFLLVCLRLSAVASSPPLKIRTSREEKIEISYWCYTADIYPIYIPKRCRYYCRYCCFAVYITIARPPTLVLVVHNIWIYRKNVDTIADTAVLLSTYILSLAHLRSPATARVGCTQLLQYQNWYTSCSSKNMYIVYYCR